MIRSFGAIVLACLFLVALQCGDSHARMKGAELCKMLKKPKNSEPYICATYYISGVAEAMQNVFISMPENTKRFDVVLAVERHLKQSPGDCRYNADTIVRHALVKSFPLQRR